MVLSNFLRPCGLYPARKCGVREALCSWKHPWAPLLTLKKSVGPEGRAGVVKPTDFSGDRGKLSGEPVDWWQRVTFMGTPYFLIFIITFDWKSTLFNINLLPTESCKADMLILRTRKYILYQVTLITYPNNKSLENLITLTGK